MSFQAGAVVRLRSGGPEMTVRSSAMDEANCVWFDGGEARFAQFPASSLDEVRDPVTRNAAAFVLTDAEYERLRTDSWTLTGLREGLAGTAPGEVTCEAIERGREEGEAFYLAAQRDHGFFVGATGHGLKADVPYKVAFLDGFGQGELLHKHACEMRADRDSLRQEREDWRAASLRIRTLLAPLLGVHVDNEPADEMVGRIAKLYEARDERTAEQRGHDKAMEWAAILAGDFDPFDATWPEGTQQACERALALFAEKLRREAGRQPASVYETSDLTATFPAPLDPKPGYYRLNYPAGSLYGGPTPCVVNATGDVWGFSVFEGKAGYITIGRNAKAYLAESGATLTPDFCRFGPEVPRPCEIKLDATGTAYLVDRPTLGTAMVIDAPLLPSEIVEIRAMLRERG